LKDGIQRGVRFSDILPGSFDPKERVKEQIEDKLDGDMPIGMDGGTVRLTVKRGDEVLAFSEVAPFPGSPASPITDAELNAKVRDCVAFGGPALSAENLLAEATRCTPHT